MSSIVRHVLAAESAQGRPERDGLSPRRVVLVPGVLALLPEYAGLSDPVAELRAACLAAVSWLTGPVEIVADEQGRRVAEHLLVSTGSTTEGAGSTAEGAGSTAEGAGAEGDASYLVVANGSACRGEKAPGHLDERSFAFDAEIDKALRTPDGAALAGVDEALGAELWAGNVAGLRRLGGLLAGAGVPVVDYADDPFGVQYWVMRWTCES
ncbi:hypothetical protein GCM10009844_04920 [Nocardioides koreensis]|uniref:Uncharacterized protein n=1 Tax=Nocardioides koreensis TaxID=433651 RepID=A0ABN2Z6T3_9ACTN